MQDENVTPEVSEQLAEASEAHGAAAGGQQDTAWRGEGNQPEGTGFAPPDTGAGDSAESEIPVGVDNIEPVEGGGDDENAPVDLASLDTGGGDAGGGDDAVDVSGAVAEADEES